MTTVLLEISKILLIEKKGVSIDPTAPFKIY